MKNRVTPGQLDSKKGFTLVELLSVLSIMAVIIGISVPAIGSLTRSSGLAVSGRVVSNLMAIARSEAINQRKRIAFVFISDHTATESLVYRKMSVGELDLDAATFSPLSKWEMLTNGVAVDFDTTLYSSAMTKPNTTTVTIAGVSTEIAYILFDPTGAAFQAAVGKPSGIRLIEGFFSSAQGQVIPTSAQKSGDSANWLQVSADSLTGRIQIERP
jgi:prepilin-type N-terminal cleavage/methylation domain-containing protein